MVGLSDGKWMRLLNLRPSVRVFPPDPIPTKSPETFVKDALHSPN